MHAVERGGRVDVPERHEVGRIAQVEHGGFEHCIEHADAAGFHDQVEIARRFDGRLSGLCGRGVDDHFGPRRILDVAMLLAAVGVGLVERDAMAASVERAHDPAIVCRRPVPIRRNQARCKERDAHSVCSFRQCR